MKNLRIKNFRNIEDSGDINLKPITILLGKNSCGKSSFVRILPLLKQTLEKDTSEPLLWFGDYVDFGNYENILPYKQKNKNFEMSFGVSIKNVDVYGRSIASMKNNEGPIACQVNIKFCEKHISSLELKYCNQTINCELDANGGVSITVNDKKLMVKIEQYGWLQAKRELLPKIINKSHEYLNMFPIQYYFYGYFFDREEDEVVQNVLSFFNKLSVRKIGDNYGRIAPFLVLQSKDELIKKLKADPYFESKSKKFDDDHEIFDNLNNLIVFLSMNYLINQINQLLREEMDNTYYIKPIRANVTRYYRIQGLNINQIDSDGSNLPMVLYNLGSDKAKFEKWCKERFGLVFSVSEHNGQMSLIVEEKTGGKTNLADAGYGYSQVLPIIAQLWILTLRGKNKVHSNDSLSSMEYKIVIEQPELHLHPAFQAKLIDVFVAVIEEAAKIGGNIKLIFETHSETMINRLGGLISQKKINANNINVILVEMENGSSTFTQTTYNEDGLINHWPIGFLAAED